MKITATLLLLTASTASALQSPVQKAFGVAGIAASTLVAGPLAAPAATTPETVAISVNTDGIDPVAAAKNVFARREQLSDAAKDFVSSAKTIQKDLDGVFPAAPAISVSAPEDWKSAVSNALTGSGRLEINGEPIYVEVDSKEGFFTFKVVSPFLPQLPFLEPSAEQAAAMVLPRAGSATTPGVVAVTAPVAAKESAAAIDIGQFWEWSFTVPGVNMAFTLGQATEAATAVVAAAYASTFTYYVANNAIAEKQAKEKKEANAKKAAAKKAAAAKAKVDAAMTKEVEDEMANVAAAVEEPEAAKQGLKGLKKSVFGSK